MTTYLVDQRAGITRGGLGGGDDPEEDGRKSRYSSGHYLESPDSDESMLMKGDEDEEDDFWDEPEGIREHEGRRDTEDQSAAAFRHSQESKMATGTTGGPSARGSKRKRARDNLVPREEHVAQKTAFETARRRRKNVTKYKRKGEVRAAKREERAEERRAREEAEQRARDAAAGERSPAGSLNQGSRRKPPNKKRRFEE
ncbi:MAG: hypothetical protein M1819_003977 [Sarea resinae]|nr:MAG: hypothetical protein M1819_003977 [Sarea resinae]